MRIKSISWKKFSLPFAGPFGTGRAALALREGLILRITADNGLTGLGEASPLPEFGGGTVAEVEKLLLELAPALRGRPVNSSLEEVSATGVGASALSCGLDTAFCDLLAQEAGKPLARWLSPSTEASVPVNATIGSPDNQAAARQARQAVSEGFSCLKLKVGMASTVAEEVERVAAVREAAGSGVALRIDPNGAWGVEQAIAVLKALEPFRLQLVEQPVAAEDISGLKRVSLKANLPVAADEAVTGLETARRIIEARAAQILVIKPMVVGGLRPARQIIELARQKGLETFVTTTIDSGIGITAALHLAATLEPSGLACGLATAALLQGTLVEEVPAIREGRMFLPPGKGLGVKLLENNSPDKFYG